MLCLTFLFFNVNINVEEVFFWGLTALILIIIAIVLSFFDLTIGLFLAAIASFLAEKGKKNNEKYSNEAYTICSITIIISIILLILVPLL